MLTKHALIVLLVGLNLFLLGVLLIGSYSLPGAYAQPQARAGDFVCVTAKVRGQSYDVYYVLDLPQRRLHAFYPASQQTREHTHAGSRDLAADFGRK